METTQKNSFRDNRLRFVGCLMATMLSIDTLNPIKLICSILQIDTTIVGILCILIAFGIFYSNANEFIYFAVKIFVHSIFTIVFKSVEVIGKENIPKHGPIIFTGNHQNQFVDAAVCVATCPHRVGFLIAEKSFHKPVIGDLAKAIGSIPVARPQDSSKNGPGKIYFDGLKIFGEGTEFTKLTKKDKVRPGRSVDGYRIVQIISDTEGVLAEDPGETSPLLEKECQGVGKWATYDVLGYIDQSKMFDTVQKVLSTGNNLGIFPEGGSHDNTDLLPLKAGVAAIAFGVLDKYEKTVPIVPVGLNYFRGHRFRGRVVVEYGPPIYIDNELYKIYKDSHRAGYQTLLTQVEDSMRSVIVTAHDYSDLKLIHTFRRLFQKPNITTQEKQDLARRISAAYRIIKERYRGQELPTDIKELKARLEKYQDSLAAWGLKDYQIISSEFLEPNYSKMLYTFLHGAGVILLASIPALVLNAPVGLAARFYANEEAKKDLQASRVKLAARDVLLSKKIVFCFVAVPVLWVSYAIFLWLLTNWQKRVIALLFVCCPIFSYLGVMAVEKGLMDFNDLWPAFLRLTADFPKIAKELDQERALLMKVVKELSEKYGPSLGPIYFEKGKAWENSIRRSTSGSSGSNSSMEDTATLAYNVSDGVPVRAASSDSGLKHRSPLSTEQSD